jgi:cyclase
LTLTGGSAEDAVLIHRGKKQELRPPEKQISRRAFDGRKVMVLKNDRRWSRSVWHFLVILLVFIATTPVFGDSATTNERTVTKLAEGVYEIRHPDAPDTFPQGNTTVIIGDREVFVVDSCYLPSSAREDIAQIRQWTNKPVRYLLNTHWHYDHTMGNAAYRDAFPALEIIAHAQTKKQMEGFNPGYLERYPGRADAFKQQLAGGKNADGSPFTEGEIAELKTAIRGTEPVGVEFKDLAGRLSDLTPDISFDHELNIDIGNREVQIKFLGRGNTAGDAIVFLPKEKIAIAGDLLDHPVPYLGGGFPIDHIVTLRNIVQLEPQTIVPGHGDVLHDLVYLNLVSDFLKAVVAQVDKEMYQPASAKSVEEMQKAIAKDMDVAAWRQKFAGDNKDDRDFFDSFSFPGVVKAAFNQMKGR